MQAGVLSVGWEVYGLRATRLRGTPCIWSRPFDPAQEGVPPHTAPPQLRIS
jgi:hypothetical protein